MRVLIFDGTPDEVHALVQRLVPAGASRTPPPRPSPPRESPLTPEQVRAAIRSDEHKAIYDAISAVPRRTLASYVARHEGRGEVGGQGMSVLGVLASALAERVED